MIQIRKVITLTAVLAAVILLMIGNGCKKDASPAPTKTYNLKVKDILGVTGTVTFTGVSSSTTTIDIVLNNAPSGTHPANLYMYSEVEEGAIVITLNPVDASGKSSTEVTSMNYTQLIAYDGCIKVLKSSSEPNEILAQGDIGGNVITTTNKTYTLNKIDPFGVSGTALFEKRVNGNTLVTISLEGLVDGQVYPATINLGSIESVGGGPVVKTLSNVVGTTGTSKSYTNIRKLNGGIDITYDDWLIYLGYINIYQTSVDLGNIICHGNIGSN